jgi:hypothetical protein
MNRRDVLRAAAAFPAIFGLGGCSRSPSWFGEALGKMRGEGKPGLVLRLPADPALRCAYGHEMSWRMEDTSAEGLEVSRQAVFICLEDEAVRTLISGAREGETLLLIDADGVALDGRALSGPADLCRAAGEMLDGPGLSRLQARAATQPVARLALARRDHVDAALESAFGALAKTPPALPYGAVIGPSRSQACSEKKNCGYGACLGACGMASFTPGSRTFVKFLAK